MEPEDPRDRRPGGSLELANGGGVLLLDADVPRVIYAGHRDVKQLLAWLPDAEGRR